MPDELGGEQLAGHLDGRMGEAVNEVKHMAAPALGDNRALSPSWDVAEEGKAGVVDWNVLEPQASDGAVGEDLRVILLVLGHGLEVDASMQGRDRHPGEASAMGLASPDTCLMSVVYSEM